MKAKVLFVSIPLGIGLFVFSSIPDAQSYTNGSPDGRTGAPNDNNGSTCTSCHSGTATTQAGLITSNIPASGYVPGSTYQLTASVSLAGRTKFGFQVSPQDGLGNKIGNLVATNTAETKTTGMGKYVTHKSAGTSGPNGTKSWTFDWTAPSTGVGQVTFYGAFNCANSNNMSSGDIIYLSTLQATEAPASIGETRPTIAFTMSPNPAVDQLFIQTGQLLEDALVTIYTLEGRLVQTNQFDAFQSDRFELDIRSLPSGVYLLKLNTKDKQGVQRFVKTQ